MSDEEREPDGPDSQGRSADDEAAAQAAAVLPMGIGVGMALGAGIGVALDNIALGIGGGLFLGSLGAAVTIAAKARGRDR